MALIVVDTWVGESGEDAASTIIDDGTYLYVSLNNGHKVVKINPSGMNTTDSFDFVLNEPVRGLAHDGTYLYAGRGSNPA